MLTAGKLNFLVHIGGGGGGGGGGDVGWWWGGGFGVVKK